MPEGIATTGPDCQVCLHPEIQAINAAILDRKYLSDVSAQYGFNHRVYIHRHVQNCLKTSFADLRKDHKLKQTQDLDEYFHKLVVQAEENLDAAKQVLMVDGVLNLSPRDWEVSIVYFDHNDLDKRTKEPKKKTAKLSSLLAKIESSGFEPAHTYIKSEDARKTYRDAIGVLESLGDKVAKLAIHKENRASATVETLQDELRGLLMRASEDQGTSYAFEAQRFLELKGDKLAPSLRTWLAGEAGGMSAIGSPVSLPPLAAAQGQVKALHPSPDPTPGTMAKPIEETKIQNESPIEKNSGEFSSENHDEFTWR